MKFFFFLAYLKFLKKGVGSGVGSGSRAMSQRYGSADPDPHQNVTDPQRCVSNRGAKIYRTLVPRVYVIEGSRGGTAQDCGNHG
jgi:hypothetical protein